MRVSELVVLVSLGAFGCSFDRSNQLADDQNELADATPGSDAVSPADAVLGCENFAALFDACSISPTSGLLSLTLPGPYIYDTDEATLTDPLGALVPHRSEVFAASAGAFHALVADSFSLGAESSLRAIGELPLAIASFGDLEVAGIIDVSAGAAGSRESCEPGEGGEGGDRTGGGGGGGGGGFQGTGGDGGEGDGDGIDQGTPGTGGLASSLPASPLGGCAGGDGGDGEDPGGKGGVGGGAIYLSSATKISVSGGVTAGGEGGEGGEESGGGFADAGGGGGGSGGYVMLEAPSVVVTGVIAANGGGGGEGSGNGSAGNAGLDGGLDASPASGGANGSPSGSDGGAGAAANLLNGAGIDGAENGGGGGGGGAAGFILVFPSQSLGGTISPAAL